MAIFIFTFGGRFYANDECGTMVKAGNAFSNRKNGSAS